MRHTISLAFLTLGILSVTHQASATNFAPPTLSIPNILDLALPPTPVGSDLLYQSYSSSFTASTTSSMVLFAFRNDPGYFAFDDARVAAVATPAINLLANPDFESPSPAGNGGNAGSPPPGWTLYLQDPSLAGLDVAGPDVYDTGGGAGLSGLTSSSGSNFWATAQIGGYDGLSQTVTTIPGTIYTVTFQLAHSNDTAFTTSYSQTNTSPAGVVANGLDVAVYAGSLPVLEPGSMAVLGLGLTALGFARWRPFKR